MARSEAGINDNGPVDEEIRGTAAAGLARSGSASGGRTGQY